MFDPHDRDIARGLPPSRRRFLSSGAAIAALPLFGSLPARAATVRIGLNRNVLFFPVWVAAERGFYAARGIDATLQEIGGGVELRTALLSGSIDAIVQSPEGSALLFEQGQRLVNIVSTQGRLTWVLVLGRQHRGRVQPGDIQALRGMRIAVTSRGSGTEMQLQALLRQGGLQPNRDVTIIASGTYAAGVAAMERSQVDGVLLVEPVTSIAIAQGALIFVDYRTGAVYPNSDTVPMGSLAVTAEYLAANDGTARAITEAVVDAMVYISRNPAWASEYLARLTDLTREQASTIIEKEFVRNQAVISEIGWNTLVQILRDGGVVRRDVPYRDVNAVQFLPIWERYARETQ